MTFDLIQIISFSINVFCPYLSLSIHCDRLGQNEHIKLLVFSNGDISRGLAGVSGARDDSEEIEETDSIKGIFGVFTPKHSLIF